jgi:hypothetical protein
MTLILQYVTFHFDVEQFIILFQPSMLNCKKLILNLVFFFKKKLPYFKVSQNILGKKENRYLRIKWKYCVNKVFESRLTFWPL